MARKKKGNIKASPKEDMDRELQEDALRVQQLLSFPSDSPLGYPSPDNELERMGRNNRGKGRVYPRPSDIQDSTSHGLSVYQSNYQQRYEEDHLSAQRQHQANTSSRSLVQNSSQDWSRDGPSGGFFEGSSGIEIKGGKFNQTYGHHTNVTIHVNQPREEDDVQQQQQQQQQRQQQQQQLQRSFPLTSMSPPQAPSYNTSLPPMQDVQRGQFPSMLMYEQSPSMPIHNIASPSVRDIHHGQFPSMNIYEQGPSTSIMIYSPDNSNKIYERHLGLKQRGFPLWIPEPNRRLPMSYRRKGVHVGDVGIITPSGAFSFLFNICLPADHPINPPTLPDGFVPIDPSIHPMDIREYSEFKPESYLASTAIEKIHNDPPFRGLSFVTSAAEGAVLTLPDGAIALDLENIPRFRAYAAANIESWYRYVNGPRGREAKNGEVRLVIGCDKATSWGMAAVANMTQHKTHYLKYRSLGDGGATSAPIPLYKWEYTGLAEARVGPDLPEIADLKKHDDSDIAVDGKYWNQCLFMRTLNPTLSDDIFEAINQELESALIQESRQSQDRGGSSSSTTNSGAQMSNIGQQPGNNSTSQTGPASDSLESATEKLVVDNIKRDRVKISRSPSAPKSHPADVLNKLLLQKVPNCRVVITQDGDWCSIIKENDELMPSPSEIAERVLAAHRIMEDNGVVFLEPKEGLQSALRGHQIPSGQPVNENAGSQSHQAGSLRLTTTSSTSLAPRGSELAWRPPSRTGSLHASATLSTTLDIVRLQMVSDRDRLAPPSEESLRETLNMGYIRSETTPYLGIPEKYQWVLTVLAVISLLAQAVQLGTPHQTLLVQPVQHGDISPHQTAFWKYLELVITLVFDFEVALTIRNNLPMWSSFLNPVENRIDLISAVVSTVIQLPVIHRSRLYAWLSFAEMLRMHRVPIAIPRTKQFLMAISGHLYRRLNTALFLVVGNFVGMVYLFRNVIGRDSFGPKLSSISHGELAAVFCGVLCLTVCNVFAFNVLHAIYLGKIDRIEPDLSSAYRLESWQSRLAIYLRNLLKRLRGVTDTQRIPLYGLTGNSNERWTHIFPRDATRSARHHTQSIRMTKPIQAIRALCWRLVKPPTGERIYGHPLQPLFKTYIILVIISNIIVSCIATPTYRSQYHEPILNTWFGQADCFFVSTLLIEFIVKTLGNGLYTAPDGYFSNAHNWLDFLVMLGNAYNLVASFASTNSMGTFSRSLRALSVLRFITLSKTIRKSIKTILFSAAGRVFDATTLAILYILPYGIWNIKIFSTGMMDAESNELNLALFNFMPCIFLMTLLISILGRVGAANILNNPEATRLEKTSSLKSLYLVLRDEPSRIIAIAYLLATVPPLVDVFVHPYATHSLGVFIFDALAAIGNFGSTLVALYLKQDINITGLHLQGVFLPGVLFKLFYPKRGFKMFINVVRSSFSVIFGFLGIWLVLLTFYTILTLEVFGLPQPYMEVPLRTDVGHIVTMLTLWGSGKSWNQYIDSCNLQSIPSFPLRSCNSRAWVYTLFISWTFINSYISVQAYTCIIAERFSYFLQFFGKVPSVLSTNEIEAVKHIWSQFCNKKTGLLERRHFSAFLSRLNGTFEVRSYPKQYSIQNIMKLSRHDGTSVADSQGIGQIDLAKLIRTLRTIDHAEIKRRKRVYAGIYYEAELQTRIRDGITFTQMLMMLSYHKFVVNKFESFSFQEILERSAIDEKVDELICFDRMKSLLRMAACRRRFLKYSLGRREHAIITSDTAKSSSKPWNAFKEPNTQLYVPTRSPLVKDSKKGKDMDTDLIDILFPPNDPAIEIPSIKKSTPVRMPSYANVDTQ